MACATMPIVKDVFLTICKLGEPTISGLAKNRRIANKKAGFTIVELLVVIVVIGILAAIAIVSYTGIIQKVKIASLQSDLSSASRQIKLFQVTSPTGDYPTANNCPTPGATEICLKYSNGNSYGTSYTVNNSSNPKTFSLTATNGTIVWHITNDSTPIAGAFVDPDWLTIGTQTWAKANLNIGTMITGATAQTNNAITEKYCYNNLESNCTTYGGLYQWNEMMQYVTTEGAQGICPASSHIPSDTEWKTLEMALGMTQVQADLSSAWRGTDQGTQLKVGGTSGMNIPLAGDRVTNGLFSSLDANALFWSSTQSSSNAWSRYLGLSDMNVLRVTDDKAYGFTVRCLKN